MNDRLLARLQAYDHALTASEIAEILNVSKSTIHRLCAERKIPHFRASGIWFAFIRPDWRNGLLERQAVTVFKRTMKREEREARRA